MDVQTSIADAKKAEQRVITVTKNGEADAAKSKWDQEVIKAKAETEAQQKYEVGVIQAKQGFEVAQWERKAAVQNKQKNILDGQGEAEKRKLILSADGALEMKLDAMIQIQQAWATALGNYGGNIVPSWISGGQSYTQGGSNAANDFMNLMNMQAAKNLNLDMSVPAGAKSPR